MKLFFRLEKQPFKDSLKLSGNYNNSVMQIIFNNATGNAAILWDSEEAIGRAVVYDGF